VKVKRDGIGQWSMVNFQFSMVNINFH